MNLSQERITQVRLKGEKIMRNVLFLNLPGWVGNGNKILSKLTQDGQKRTILEP